MTKLNKSKWLRIGLLILSVSALFGLFQNMSPLEEVDFSKVAPPESAPKKYEYLPEHVRGRSAEAITKEILRHNLAEPLRDLEQKIEEFGTWSSDEGEADSASLGERRPAGVKSKYKVKAGVSGRSAMGVAFEKNYKIKCEYSPGEQSLQVSFDQPLSQNAHLTMKHNSEGQRSSVNFSYQW